MSQQTTHIITRGICLEKEHILLAWHIDKQYYFLPGGHVETGESVTTALRREFLEELDLPIVCKDFVVLFEHSWQNGETTQHELTTIFLVDAEKNDAPKSQVKHLEFHWVPVVQLPHLNFLPKVLSELIINVAAKKHTPSFTSTMI